MNRSTQTQKCRTFCALKSSSSLQSYKASLSPVHHAPSSVRSCGRIRPLERLELSKVLNDQYRHNRAGPIWSEASGTFKAVTDTTAVHTPSSPSGSASAWVGIDRDTCENAILQTSINFTYDSSAISYYDAWYERYLDHAHDSSITIRDGDVLVLAVTATSTTSGVIKIQNLSNGQTVSKQLTSSYPRCKQDAEWIVEDFEDASGNIMPFRDFDSVRFTDGYATTSPGSQTSFKGAPAIEIEQNGQVFTESSSGVRTTC